ncbi:MAG: acyl-[acyl-carrier-protein]--UDP-N-acetylglucosamine O-acyltransferase, partial [Chloroflexi bacterium]|nr:acyl-[acyl-carrier-protein]--UDP-N-acetylglucosamine O-acyltransferase [Chloroflexota bacterium]
MSRKIDPRAIVDPKAEIEDDVEIGPFSVIEGGVYISSGTKVGPYV